MGFLSTALTVLITAALTAAFAMQRFKSETRWARKAYAYSQIRKAMVASIEYCESYMDQCYDFPEESDKQGLADTNLRRKKSIEKAKNTVADEYYFISPDARSAFHDFQSRPPYPWYMDGEDMAATDKEAAEQVLNTIDRLAQKDLATHTTNVGKITFHYLKKIDGWFKPLAKRLQSKA